jgi:hypothetical protein
MSNADKRTVSTDALETLGTILTKDEKRDAIHLAVIPAKAGCILKAGMYINLVNGTALPDSRGLGIVDPFVSGEIKDGQLFWMILKPRIIKSLRHVWSHPDFEDESTNIAPNGKSQKEISEAWLRNYCANADCPGYEQVIGAAMSCDGDDYIHFDGEDAHGEIPKEFWFHFENVTGVKVKNPPEYFSCSC